MFFKPKDRQENTQEMLKPPNSFKGHLKYLITHTHTHTRKPG